MTYQKVNSSIVSKDAMNNFKEMFPLPKISRNEQGLFYLGDSFPVESFPGGNFPGTILPGSVFRAAIFWEATFLEPCCFEIQTHMRQLKKLCCLLQKSRKTTIPLGNTSKTSFRNILLIFKTVQITSQRDQTQATANDRILFVTICSSLLFNMRSLI